jgi:TetR/AcrR family transcriptional repressor of bet genes
MDMKSGNSRATTSPQRRSVEAEQTRRDILAATIEVIAEHSLSGTTIDRVAAVAGTAAGTVILHFKRKEALLIAALEHSGAEFDAARRAASAGGEADPAAALRRLVDLYLDPAIASVSKISVWYGFWGEAGSRRVYLDRVAQVDRDELADLVKLFTLMIERGGYRQLDAQATAKAFFGLREFIWQDIMAEGDAHDRAASKRLIYRYLAGLFPKEFGRRR